MKNGNPEFEEAFENFCKNLGIEYLPYTK